MLDHLKTGDRGEGGALGDEVLGQAGPVVQGQGLASGVGSGGLDRLAGGIDAEHVVAVPGQRLGRQPGAAADIEDAGRTAQQGFDPADSGWVHSVQRLHGAVRVPPARRQLVELLHFGR